MLRIYISCGSGIGRVYLYEWPHSCKPLHFNLFLTPITDMNKIITNWSNIRVRTNLWVFFSAVTCRDSIFFSSLKNEHFIIYKSIGNSMWRKHLVYGRSRNCDNPFNNDQISTSDCHEGLAEKMAGQVGVSVYSCHTDLCNSSSNQVPYVLMMFAVSLCTAIFNKTQ